MYEGDQPAQLAMNFCRIYSISSEKYCALKQVIEQTFEANKIHYEKENEEEYLMMLETKKDIAKSTLQVQPVLETQIVSPKFQQKEKDSPKGDLMVDQLESMSSTKKKRRRHHSKSITQEE